MLVWLHVDRNSVRPRTSLKAQCFVGKSIALFSHSASALWFHGSVGVWLIWSASASQAYSCVVRTSASGGQETQARLYIGATKISGFEGPFDSWCGAGDVDVCSGLSHSVETLPRKPPSGGTSCEKSPQTRTFKPPNGRSMPSLPSFAVPISRTILRSFTSSSARSLALTMLILSMMSHRHCSTRFATVN